MTLPPETLLARRIRPTTATSRRASSSPSSQIAQRDYAPALRPAPRDRAARPPLPRRHRAPQDARRVRDGRRASPSWSPNTAAGSRACCSRTCAVDASPRRRGLWAAPPYDARMVTLPTARLERTADGTAVLAGIPGRVSLAPGRAGAGAARVPRGATGCRSAGQGRAPFVDRRDGLRPRAQFPRGVGGLARGPARPRRLHFVSVEKPALRARGPRRGARALRGARSRSRARCRSRGRRRCAGFHRVHFDGGHVILTLLLGDARAMLPQLVARADALLPRRLLARAQSRHVVARGRARDRAPRRARRHARHVDAWRAACARRCARCGIRVEKRPGFAAKREMLVRPYEAPAAPVPGRRASAVRSWSARASRARSPPSGSPRAAGRSTRRRAHRAPRERRGRWCAPSPTCATRSTRSVSRSAFLYALQHYRALQHDGYHLAWNRCGVLQLAEDDDEARALRGDRALPGISRRDSSQFVDARARARRSPGAPVRGPGWWFPAGRAGLAREPRRGEPRARRRSACAAGRAATSRASSAKAAGGAPSTPTSA